MTTTWILVANASKALCFERQSDSPDLELIDTFLDPLGRAKGSDLSTDRAGYEAMGRGHRGTAFAPHLDDRTKEHEAFAHKMADFLNRGLASDSCQRLAIIASSPFLGEVKSHLNAQSVKALMTTAAKDLTSFSGKELTQRVGQALHPAD